MNAVTLQERAEIVAQPRGSATPADLVRYALDGGADIERLEKLMAMQIQWEEREAKKAFVLAMAEFKQNPPEIFKTKQVSFTTRDGDTTSYRHATLGGVTEPIINGLAQHGISHRWDTTQDGQTITVTCTLTHKLGHSESTSLSGAPDSSGKKNPIQQMASCINYLQRYTLLAATGIATKDMDAEDDDGRGTGAPEVPSELLQEAQAAAAKGWKEFATWIKARTEEERLALNPESDNLKSAAKAADRAVKP